MMKKKPKGYKKAKEKYPHGRYGLAQELKRAPKNKRMTALKLFHELYYDFFGKSKPKD